MQLIQPHQGPPIKLRLARNLVRSLKRGHPWVFADALRQRPPAPPGAQALLLDNKKGREIARGFYDDRSPLAFRVCTVKPGQVLDNRWAQKKLERALGLRRILFDETTTGFRLFNGEGDGLPGLVCDVYGQAAVIQLDGAGPAGFWRVRGVAQWIAQALSLRSVYQRRQVRSGADQGSEGRTLVGQPPTGPVSFIENGVHFTADIIRGQKTGFFLDQRANRQRIRKLAGGRRVLNLFGYTGGFSVYAALGGASHVTTVDRAGPALEAASDHWGLNGLHPRNHRVVAADAFEFLEKTIQKEKNRWDLVIVDPPSFATAKEAVPKALRAYQKLIAAGATVTAPEGLLAAASCSSHVRPEAFLSACEAGLSQASRRATLLGIYDQPADHPTPLAFPEFRYLKFILMRVE
jgi:23S rRNA (cytosine1962-C5)-methyltransferase